MASLISDSGNRWRIQFVFQDVRRTIRLGKMPRRAAEAVRRHIEALIASRLSSQAPDAATAAWLGSLAADSRLRGRLANAGLIEPLTKPGVPTLGEFLGGYLQNRAAELKPGTMTVLYQAARWMRRFLGENIRLDEITPAHGDQFRAAILKGRAKATANKWTRISRQFLNAAVDRGLIGKNPFDHLKGLAVVGDQSRRVLVPEADIRRVLDAIPCPQFRLVVALARWGGLRVPSEVLALAWADINWEARRMVVRSSKTAHHAHGGVRVVPIFAELLPFLQEAWDAAEPGTVPVITRYRDPKQNLRTQFNRWCMAAGVAPWGKPFQNMRATRATELADQYPSHVCAAWLGHTEKIADRFYRSVTDEHFERATSGAKSGALVAQKAAQPMQASDCQTMTKTAEVVPGREDSRLLTSAGTTCPSVQMGGTGFEPVTSSV